MVEWWAVSTGVMVASLGFLYAKLFKMDLRAYLPFLALSQVLWGFLALAHLVSVKPRTAGGAVRPHCRRCECPAQR